MACKTFATLLTGAKMPLIGLGTWQGIAGELEGPLQSALKAGYRLIDTATAYGNEDVIGKLIEENWLTPRKLKREDLFISTKLPPSGMRPGGPDKWIRQSLEKLRMDHVDMYLIHMPFTWKLWGPDESPVNPDGKYVVEEDTDHIAVWKEMEALVDAGKAKHIGLSNFNQRQVQNILDNCRIKPANLQIELHMYIQQRPLVDFCHKNGIVVTAYSPLGSPGADVAMKTHFGANISVPDLLRNPVVLEVAKKYKKYAAQILLKHIVDRGIVAVPKSLSDDFLQQNINIFDFKMESADIEKINALDKGKDGRIFDMKFNEGFTESHPQFPFNEYP
ncbi:Aldo-keto reductase family 1 member A1 [Frankliniella fusca]|uniref:Aldo-keto reductase family 1 member A1 n=1 Tax=Frankliniella fusca TaxID=407009 RepID=A0AAE1I2B7_9NEOP|nr:Aldo-keto reductase family 1 member A1 [Frankliniella fusca]